MVQGTTVVRATREQVSSEVGGETVILSLKNGMYYGLNAIGTRIWALLQSPRSVTDIRDVLLAEYNVTPETCERDLLRVIERLTDAGLVEVDDAQAA